MFLVILFLSSEVAMSRWKLKEMAAWWGPLEISWQVTACMSELKVCQAANHDEALISKNKGKHVIVSLEFIFFRWVEIGKTVGAVLAAFCVLIFWHSDNDESVSPWHMSHANTWYTINCFHAQYLLDVMFILMMYQTIFISDTQYWFYLDMPTVNVVQCASVSSGMVTCCKIISVVVIVIWVTITCTEFTILNQLVGWIQTHDVLD